jgi:hypothetical protein
MKINYNIIMKNGKERRETGDHYHQGKDSCRFEVREAYRSFFALRKKGFTRTSHTRISQEKRLVAT